MLRSDQCRQYSSAHFPAVAQGPGHHLQDAGSLDTLDRYIFLVVRSVSPMRPSHVSACRAHATTWRRATTDTNCCDVQFDVGEAVLTL